MRGKKPLPLGEQGWRNGERRSGERRSGGRRSGENTRLPPVWPGFDFRTRHHTWAEFVGSRPCSERLYSGYSGFAKTQHFQIPIRSGISRSMGLSVELLLSFTLVKQIRFILFIYLFIYLFVIYLFIS